LTNDEEVWGENVKKYEERENEIEAIPVMLSYNQQVGEY